MNYLLDKKIKRKKFFYIVFFVVILLVLFYFRSGIWSGLAYGSHRLFRPILIFGNNLGQKFSGVGSYFVSKNSLYKESENLKLELGKTKARMSNYDSLLDENVNLKETLGRKSENRNIVLAAVLSKPNQSPYDTLIIDRGIKQSIEIGNTVFALGNVPIGRISDIYPGSSKVVLFSNPGEKIQGVVSGGDIFVEIIGRGGGNFEMILPRDLVLTKGNQVVLPGITPYVLGIVETILSDPRDPFIKALLVSPVNIQELKFVEVEK